MNRFHKVSLEQFIKDYFKTFPNVEHTEETVAGLTECYNNLPLPKRSTKLAAGYDFHSPYSFSLRANQTIVIPTGIKVELDSDKFLAVFPRSGHGFKYRIQLDNTVGIIDADYIFAENEGHIMIKLTCDCKNPYEEFYVESYDRIAQGIILQYFTTTDDDAEGQRTGGFGSTDAPSE